MMENNPTFYVVLSVIVGLGSILVIPYLANKGDRKS